MEAKTAVIHMQSPLHYSMGRTVLLAILAFGIALSCVHGGSLLQNGDFKKGTNGWYLFIPPASEAANCSLEPEPNGHDVSAGMRLTSDSWARYALSSTQRISVQDTARYKISAWIKAGEDLQIKDNTPGIVIRVLCRNADGKDMKAGHYFLGFNGQAELSSGAPSQIVTEEIPTEWTRIHGIIEFPEGTDSIDVQLTSFETKGSLFWSDVAFEEVSDTEVLTPLLEAKKKEL